MVSIEKGFPCAIALSYMHGSNNITWPNISGCQLRRLDRTLSHTTRLPRYYKVSSRVFFSVALWKISVSTEGFMIYRPICIHV
jgi:hypothetical protein